MNKRYLVTLAMFLIIAGAGFVAYAAFNDGRTLADAKVSISAAETERTFIVFGATMVATGIALFAFLFGSD